MSNLDNLISKILNDGKEKSNQIIESANKKASEIIQEHINIAQKEKDQILNNGKIEAEKSAERIILGKKLELRNNNLSAKQSIIDKVFDIVLKKLNDMSKDEFWQFLCNNLLRMDLDDDEIILPSKYNVTNIDELNNFLKKNNKNGNLKLYNGKRNINGGFILIKEGIENNNTFEALVSFYRYELESDIIKNLF